MRAVDVGNIGVRSLAGLALAYVSYTKTACMTYTVILMT